MGGVVVVVVVVGDFVVVVVGASPFRPFLLMYGVFETHGHARDPWVKLGVNRLSTIVISSLFFSVLNHVYVKSR